MKDYIFKFLFCAVAISFLVSCCGTKVPKITVSHYADHPVRQESAFFILHEFLIPEDIPEVGGETFAVVSGSGGAIRSVSGGTEIITAGHVCDTPENMPPDTVSEFSVFDPSGTQYSAEIVAIHNRFDLCLLRIDHKVPTLKLARRDPARGDKVFFAGYPAGIYQPGFLHFFDGYFAGKDSSLNSVFNLAVTGGSSGGVVVDRRGNVVGIISAVLSEFHHITFGASRDQIESFLDNTTECEATNPCKI